MQPRKAALSAVIFIALAIAYGQRTSQPSGSQCEALIKDALKQVDALKPGDTRESVERSFEEDGGLQWAKHSRYMFKRCNFIKIEVEFSGDEIDKRDFRSTDKIVSVSRPYLEYPVKD